MGILAVFMLAACEGDGSTAAGRAVDASASAMAPAAMTAVVQPQPLTLTPIGGDMQAIGADRTISVEPVVIETAVDLQPVTR